METTTRNILALPYDDLNLSERVNAERDAYNAGWDAAADDRGAAGGIEAVMYPWKAYYYNIIEPAVAADQIAESVLINYREHDHYDDDPRVRRFAAGWEDSMSSAAEDDFEQRWVAEDYAAALADAQREAVGLIEYYDQLDPQERARWFNNTLFGVDIIIQALVISDVRRIDQGLAPKALS